MVWRSRASQEPRLTYLTEVERPAPPDRVKVKIEIRPELLSDRTGSMQALRERIVCEVPSISAIRTELELAEPRRVERFAGKASRVANRRRMGVSPSTVSADIATGERRLTPRRRC